MYLLRKTSLFLLAGLPALTFAQISFGGVPPGLRNDVAHLPQVPVVTMPQVDVPALMAEDDARTASGIKGPYRFGSNHAVDLDLHNSGIWGMLPDGAHVWRLGIECPGALSINFEFNTYVVPEGGRVYVYNEAGEWLGAFTAESNPGHEELGVTQLPGDRITIEYVEPAAVSGKGILRIGQVTHGYRDLFGAMKSFGQSGSCNNNVVCPEGDPWRDQIRSVAMITIGGSGICTGQLINNCAQDNTPYFLTARHCTLGSNPGTWTFRFDWQSPVCTPNTNAASNKTVGGAQLLVASAASDVSLLQLNSTPPAWYDVYYTGWDKSGDMPTHQTCIHHPSGDIKKISFDNDPAGQANTNLGSGTAQCWRIFNWDDGTTEGGSSGSGLWNQNGLLIGQLYGGQANCSNNINDYFGRLDVSYPSLEPWLGTCGNTLGGLESPVGIMENGAPGDLTAWPDPSEGHFTVDLPKGSTAGTLQVSDPSGRIVLEQKVASNVGATEVDLGRARPGCYIVRFADDHATFTRRVVIAR